MKRQLLLPALVIVALLVAGCPKAPSPETPQQWVFASAAVLESNYRLAGDLVRSGVISPERAETVKKQLDRIKTQVDTYLKIAIDPDRELADDKVETIRNLRAQLLELQRELRQKKMQQGGN